MKLYYAPGACSMAPHIVVHEASIPIQIERVDLGTHRTEQGADYRKINPKGYVPALTLENGDVLTEVAVVLQFLADQNPGSGLAPAVGTMQRYRIMEWLNFVATEVHKSFGPLFNPKAGDDVRATQIRMLGRRFEFLSTILAKQAFLAGPTFSIADAYLFTILNWVNFVKLDLQPWPVLQEYLARVRVRPAVQATLKAEGLA